jgi:Spy/CpxP family protein refolding chaperone
MFKPYGMSVAIPDAKQILYQLQKGEQTMKKLSIVFLAVLITAALAATTFAYGWGGGWGRGHARGAGGFGCDRDFQAVPELGLTDAQTAKIRDMREAYQKDIKPLRDKMYSKRGELKLLWLQKTPDRQKITAAQKEIGSLRNQMDEKRTSHRLDFFNILTPEQQTKAQALAAGKGFGPGKGGRGMGPGMGPGTGPMGPGGER